MIVIKHVNAWNARDTEVKSKILFLRVNQEFSCAVKIERLNSCCAFTA